MTSVERSRGEGESEIARILQSGLDELRNNRADISSIVKKYPHLQAELQPELEVAVRLTVTGKLLEPRSGFLEASRARLLDHIRSKPASAGLPGQPHPLFQPSK